MLLDRFLKPPTIVRAIEKERMTFATGVPTILTVVLRLLRSESGRDLLPLRRGMGEEKELEPDRR